MSDTPLMTGEEPTTQAGKRLLARLRKRAETLGGLQTMGADFWDTRHYLPAIEAEAAAMERERLRRNILPLVESIENLTDRQAVYNVAGDIRVCLDAAQTHPPEPARTDPLVVGHTPPFDSVEKGERP